MATTIKSPVTRSEREAVFDAFRRWGYLAANLDPLGMMPPLAVPELALEGAAADEARRIYCGTVGVEFAHMPDGERRRWVEERMESAPARPDAARILDRLVEAELFEQILQSRYLGTKRFSLEGNTSLIPLLDEAMEAAGERGAQQILMAMSHRGRLNVLAHIVGKQPQEIFAGFEDVDPRSVLGSGDVKYHLGATGEYRTPATWKWWPRWRSGARAPSNCAAASKAKRRCWPS
jgi:2-oxoglutarate dehydrogenase E1 component